MKKITFITYVYGEEFIDFFLRWSLPSVARAIETSVVQTAYVLEYRIITTEAHISTLSLALLPFVERLGLALHIEDVDSLNLPRRAEGTTHVDVWDRAIARCDASFCLLLIPDNVYEPGFVGAFIRAMESGVDYFTNYPLYTCKESLLHGEPERLAAPKSQAELVRIFFDHAHPLIYSWLLDYRDLANLHYEIVCVEGVDDLELLVTTITEHPVGINLYKIRPADFSWCEEINSTHRTGVFYPVGSLSVDTVANQFEMIFEACARCDKQGLIAEFARSVYRKHFWFDSPLRSFRLSARGGVDAAEPLTFPTVIPKNLAGTAGLQAFWSIARRLQLMASETWTVFQRERRPVRFLLKRFVRVLAMRLLGIERFNRVKEQYRRSSKPRFAMYAARAVVTNLARRFNESRLPVVAAARAFAHADEFIPHETARRTMSKDFCLAFYSDALNSYKGRLGVKSRAYIKEGARGTFSRYPVRRARKGRRNLTLQQRADLHAHLNAIFFQRRAR